jgi:hypothetical protein
VKYFFGIVCFLLASVSAAPAQTFDVLASDFMPDGKVIELDVPDALDGVRFGIAVYDGQSTSINLTVARAGRHCYETRHLPEWHGNVKTLAITHFGNVSGRLKKPTVADDIDMFLEPERMTPATINLLVQHRFLGWSWTMCLLAIAAVSTFLFRVLSRKTILISSMFGFLIAWCLMDLRIMFDHSAIVYYQNKFHGGKVPQAPLEAFANQVSGIIGQETWGHAPLQGEEMFLKYGLAEHPYAAPGSGRSPTFWFTQDSREGQVVAQLGPYYLVRKNKP